MSSATLAAGSSRCLLHACTGFRPREASIGRLSLLDLWCYPSRPGQCATLIEHLVAWGFGSLAVPRSSQLEARHVQAA